MLYEVITGLLADDRHGPGDTGTAAPSPAGRGAPGQQRPGPAELFPDSPGPETAASGRRLAHRAQPGLCARSAASG